MNIPSWARVGAKVVCVHPANPIFGDMWPLREGAVYTVTGVVPESYQSTGCPTPGPVALLLAGVVNPSSHARAFNIGRFRPLITRSLEDDLAIFRPLLVPTKETQDA
jgi:hypothetical protein